MKRNNNVISHKRSEIKSIIKDFREIIKIYGFRYKKTVLKHLRLSLRSDKKVADDKKEEDIDYLQEIIDRLTRLKHTILNKINVTTKTLNIMRLKQLSICLKAMMKITIYILSTINSINHFLIRLY